MYSTLAQLVGVNSLEWDKNAERDFTYSYASNSELIGGYFCIKQQFQCKLHVRPPTALANNRTRELQQ